MDITETEMQNLRNRFSDKIKQEIEYFQEFTRLRVSWIEIDNPRKFFGDGTQELKEQIDVVVVLKRR